MKNKLGLVDIKLRMFVDTNVLIDYVEGFNDRKSVTFLNLFKKSKVLKRPRVPDVELVMSDYVLWEFYGHHREELYTRMLVEKHNYGLIGASKVSRIGMFRKANAKSMKGFGKTIREHVQKLTEQDQILYLDRLIAKHHTGFSETIDRILQCSKFPYKDAIVLVSAFFTGADRIVTRDERHMGGRSLTELREAMKSWSINPGEIEVKRPADLSTAGKIRHEYKEWFSNRNKDKIIGDAVKYYPTKNVLEIKCRSKCRINENDHLLLIRFSDGKTSKFWFRVPAVASSRLRDASTRKPITKGRHVTIEMPAQFRRSKKNWKGAWVFVAE